MEKLVLIFLALLMSKVVEDSILSYTVDLVNHVGFAFSAAINGPF